MNTAEVNGYADIVSGKYSISQLTSLNQKTNRVFSRGRIYSSLAETTGGTPLVRLERLAQHYGCQAEIVAKLEYFNPLSSVKDRIGVAMIEDAEKKGDIGPGSVIVEATSGNTGIGLGFVCAIKGYRLILVMPETVNRERTKLLTHLGAEIVLTPESEGVLGAIRHARDLAEDLPNGWMVNQDYHPANIEIHRNQTAQEILQDTAGSLDCFVAGVGTAGTLIGVGQTLKEFNSKIQVIAVEPSESPVLSKGDGASAPHGITGIGAFVPNFYDTSCVDEVVRITTKEAIQCAQICARLEGIPVGISGGAALFAALQSVQKSELHNKRIIVLIPSSAERYMSTKLFEYTEGNYSRG